MISNFLIIHELIHFFGGLLVGYVFAKKFHDFKLIFVGVAAGLLIDIDHLVDLFLYAIPNRMFDPTLITKMDFFRLSGKVIVPLHSYELIFFIFILSFVMKKWKKYLLVISLSFLIHTIIDQLTYNPFILEYSFLYRLVNHFSVSSFR